MIIKPKVTVVVPIYNVEKYLKQCLDSIISQTLKDIEIILVNDGSCDNCKEIINEYAQKDERIVAIHQENRGYGAAVNHGIYLAKGEYIGIIESDDWIESTMYEKLYNNAKANDTDISKANFYIYNSQAPKEYQNIIWKHPNQDLSKAPKGVFSILEYKKLMVFHASIWSSIYKAEFIKQIKFVETRSASYQDFPFMAEAFCRAKRISVVPEPLVHYRMEDNQNSSTIRKDERLLIMPQQCLIVVDILKFYNLYDNLKEELYYHIYLANTSFYFNIQKKYQKQYYFLLHDIFIELHGDKNFKYKYFSQEEVKLVQYFISGKYKSNKRDIKKIRRFLLSFNFSQNSFVLQILGIQISWGYIDKIKRPALFRVNIFRK